MDLHAEDPSAIPEADCVDANGKPILEHSLTYSLIFAEVLLPQGEEKQLAKVLRRSVDWDGKTIGQHHKNPLLNTLVYDIEFPNGNVKKYSAHIIAENLWCFFFKNDYGGINYFIPTRCHRIHWWALQWEPQTCAACTVELQLARLRSSTISPTFE